MEAQHSLAQGKIVTFYSYKGGTGRTMLLANVAWLLADSGKRVLVIDWDLEAPGLHRYFEPFLDDPSLEASTGVVDFVIEYATVAVSSPGTAQEPDWFLPHANLLKHAVSVNWEFSSGGLLDLVPAGRQDTAYAARVNAFDWQRFYQKLGGGVLLEAVKKHLCGVYDYVLIDSRTGVSDTSGVCTVQMPNELVVCFTLNRQSVLGASAVALSSFNQRRGPGGAPTLKIWPVPTRIDPFEKERLEFMQTLARARFSATLTHMDPDQEDQYWGNAGIPYAPYYAYEEALAAIADKPRHTGTVLSKIEAIAASLTQGEPILPMDEARRLEALRAFSTRSARSYGDELRLLAREYESIRARLESGPKRTYLMTALLARARTLGGHADSGPVAETLFNVGSDGTRIVALALALAAPQRGHVEMALAGIAESRSAFEQFQALTLAEVLLPSLDPSAAQKLVNTVNEQLERGIDVNDTGRYKVAARIAKTATGRGEPHIWSATRREIYDPVLRERLPLVECRPVTGFVRYDDVNENHGPFVTTRKSHTLSLPPQFRLSRYPVTNELYCDFVRAGGYRNDSFWRSTRVRSRLLAQDGSPGPAGWLGDGRYSEHKARHPVSGICYAEAEAFVRWLNATHSIEPWSWSLPTEDTWEYAARAEAGLTYPWGDAFEPKRCNSTESGLQDTCDVERFQAGASPLGCCDMAGNVWEFVRAGPNESRATLRGGSYLNNRFEIRSYLRLQQVSFGHRPPDFGFRLAQLPPA